MTLETLKTPQMQKDSHNFKFSANKMSISRLLMLCMTIMCMLKNVSATCGTQSWYHGWFDDYQVQYTTMSYHEGWDMFFVGGYTTKPSSLTNNT